MLNIEKCNTNICKIGECTDPRHTSTKMKDFSCNIGSKYANNIPAIIMNLDFETLADIPLFKLKVATVSEVKNLLMKTSYAKARTTY